MKLTSTQENTLRKIALSIASFTSFIGSLCNVFLKGALFTVVALVVACLLTENPDTATFGDFLKAIQSPGLAFFGAIGGVITVGLKTVLIRKK